MIETTRQYEFVSRQFASYFLGVSPNRFDFLRKETPIEYMKLGRTRRYNFSDLARLMFPDATDKDIQVMRVVANIHFAGVKRGLINSEILEKKANSKKKRRKLVKADNRGK